MVDSSNETINEQLSTDKNENSDKEIIENKLNISEK